MIETLIDYNPDTAPPAPEPFVDTHWYQDCEIDAAVLDEMIFRSELLDFINDSPIFAEIFYEVM